MVIHARPRDRRGFTLVELTAVVILLALIAGIAMVAFRDPYRNARHQATIERLEFIDPLRRVARKRSGDLVFDLGEGTATWRRRDTGRRSESVTLAAGLLISEIWTLAGGTRSSGEVIVPFHPDGTSGT